jgi:hypothetical protein
VRRDAFAKKKKRAHPWHRCEGRFRLFPLSLSFYERRFPSFVSLSVFSVNSFAVTSYPVFFGGGENEK